MRKYYVFFVLLSFSFLRCNNPSEGGKNSNCVEPPVSGSVAHIFDSQGNFVAEANLYYGSVVWNGNDCHGNKAGCGSYSVKIYYGGSTTTKNLLFADSNSIAKYGRKACDSLRSDCGSYHEIYGQVMDPMSGTFKNDWQCVCCK